MTLPVASQLAYVTRMHPHHQRVSLTRWCVFDLYSLQPLPLASRYPHHLHAPTPPTSHIDSLVCVSTSTFTNHPPGPPSPPPQPTLASLVRLPLALASQQIGHVSLTSSLRILPTSIGMLLSRIRVNSGSRIAVL
jgi:hypothetical protein